MLASSVVPAGAWSFYEDFFYGGNAEWHAQTETVDGGQRTYSTPRVQRTKWGYGQVCDYQAAVDFWINDYFYDIDYSSFHSGCSFSLAFFDFNGWVDTFFPGPDQSYTWAWWYDTDTGGQFQEINEGWIN